MARDWYFSEATRKRPTVMFHALSGRGAMEIRQKVGRWLLFLASFGFAAGTLPGVTDLGLSAGLEW
jgi:hypothetical protein